jgi:hypothetical protein
MKKKGTRWLPWIAVNHVRQEIIKPDALSAPSQIRPKPGKPHPRETPHQVETQQAMVHAAKALWKFRIHSINLVSIFNFVNDKITKLYQVGDSETILHDRNLWPDDWCNFITNIFLPTGITNKMDIPR